jgi:hypothetical protein
MARIPIFKPDGTPTDYFWSDKLSGEQPLKTVYKDTPDGVKRMKNVRFDLKRKRMRRV